MRFLDLSSNTYGAGPLPRGTLICRIRRAPGRSLSLMPSTTDDLSSARAGPCWPGSSLLRPRRASMLSLRSPRRRTPSSASSPASPFVPPEVVLVVLEIVVPSSDRISSSSAHLTGPAFAGEWRETRRAQPVTPSARRALLLPSFRSSRSGRTGPDRPTTSSPTSSEPEAPPARPCRAVWRCGPDEHQRTRGSRDQRLFHRL